MSKFIVQILIKALGVVLAPLFAYFLGKEKQENANLKASADTKAKQDSVEASPDLSSDDVIRLMRDGKL